MVHLREALSVKTLRIKQAPLSQKYLMSLIKAVQLVLVKLLTHNKQLKAKHDNNKLQ